MSISIWPLRDRWNTSLQCVVHGCATDTNTQWGMYLVSHLKVEYGQYNLVHSLGIPGPPLLHMDTFTCTTLVSESMILLWVHGKYMAYTFTHMCWWRRSVTHIRYHNRIEYIHIQVVKLNRMTYNLPLRKRRLYVWLRFIQRTSLLSKGPYDSRIWCASHMRWWCRDLRSLGLLNPLLEKKPACLLRLGKDLWSFIQISQYLWM